jgi:hypothetical protein
MARYDVAALLHKGIDEVDAMTAEQFTGWLAWSRIRNRG